MRLINTTTMRLEEHKDSNPLKYAILSHRWYAAHEEVSFHDLQSGLELSTKKGWSKLQNFCRLVSSMGFEYAWSDVCCINKDSTTELMTALNSMYRWYAKSSLCIAFLQDLRPDIGEFASSEWFKRGWTLQELIAPKHMAFYDGDWQYVGDKASLLQSLSTITGVPSAILAHAEDPQRCSIAQRMSWAAGRVTERIEDRAYSLLGLFDVSLEMIYGDRERAFIRLQEKIIQHSSDESIFTWALDSANHPTGYAGLLAPSPDSFAGSGDVAPLDDSKPFSLTNVGLCINVITAPYQPGIYEAYLGWPHKDKLPPRATIYSILVTRNSGTEQWTRVSNSQGRRLTAHTLNSLRDMWNDLQSQLVERPLTVRQVPRDRISERSTPMMADGFWLRDLGPLKRDSNIQILSRGRTQHQDHMCLHEGSVGTAGIVHIQPRSSQAHSHDHIRWMKFGFDSKSKLLVLVASQDGAYPLCREAVLEAYVSGSICNKPYAATRGDDWWNNSWQSHRTRQPALAAAGARWKKGYHVFREHEFRDANVATPFAYNKYYDGLRELDLNVRLSLQPSPDGSECIWTIDFRDRADVDPVTLSLDNAGPRWHGNAGMVTVVLILTVVIIFGLSMRFFI